MSIRSTPPRRHLAVSFALGLVLLVGAFASSLVGVPEPASGTVSGLTAGLLDSTALAASPSSDESGLTAEPEAAGDADGLDVWLLVGSIALFLGIVVAITLLRRWR